MDILNGYLINTNDIVLDKVEYNSRDWNTEHEKVDSLEIVVVDNTKAEIDDDSVSITLTRNAVFKPDIVFDLTVSFKKVYKINKKVKDQKNIDLNKLINDNIDDLVGEMASYASFLISQITSSGGKLPLVTPPSLIVV